MNVDEAVIYGYGDYFLCPECFAEESDSRERSKASPITLRMVISLGDVMEGNNLVCNCCGDVVVDFVRAEFRESGEQGHRVIEEFPERCPRCGGRQIHIELESGHPDPGPQGGNMDRVSMGEKGVAMYRMLSWTCFDCGEGRELPGNSVLVFQDD